MANAGGSGGGSPGAIRAGGAFVELGTKDAGLHAGLSKAKAKTAAFAGQVRGMAAGAALSAGAVSAAFVALGADAVGNLVTTGQLADKLGIGADKLSAFAYAAETTGQNLDDLEGHFENFSERVKQAAQGSGEAIAEFRKLGINPADLVEQDQVEQIITLSKAMAGVTNETKRLGILSSMGGDKFQMLNPLLKLGPDEIRRRMAESDAIGNTVSKEDVKAAQEIQYAWFRVSTAVKSAVAQIGQAILPQKDRIKQLADGITSVAATVGGWIGRNRELVIAVVAAVVVIGGLAAGAMALGLAAAAAATAVGGLVALFGGIAAAAALVSGPLLLVVGGLAAAAAACVALFAFTDAWSQIKAAVADVAGEFFDFGGTATAAWEGVVAAVSRGDLTAAFGVVTAAVEAVWAGMMVGLTKAWIDFKSLFVDGWHRGVGEIQTAWRELQGTLDPTESAAATKAAVDAIRTELDAAQAARTAARGSDLAAAMNAAAEANSRLAAAAAAAKGGAAAANAAAEKAIDEAKDVAKTVQLSASRGAFQSGDFTRFFAEGRSNIQQQQLKVQQEIAANTFAALKLDAAKGGLQTFK